jgi:hypothetical protein
LLRILARNPHYKTAVKRQQRRAHHTEHQSAIPVVLGLPFLVPAVHSLLPVLGGLFRGVRAKPILSGAAWTLLDFLMLEAVPPALVLVLVHDY